MSVERRRPAWLSEQRVCPFCRLIQAEPRYRCADCGSELTALDRVRPWRRLRRGAARLGLGEETRAAGVLLALASLPLAATYFGVQFALAFLRPASRFGPEAARLAEIVGLTFFAAIAAVLGLAIWALMVRQRA